MTDWRETSEGREALAARHEDRVALFAPQSTNLTIFLQYDATLGRWYCVLTESDGGRVIASFDDWSSLDVLREAALVADKQTVAR